MAFCIRDARGLTHHLLSAKVERYERETEKDEVLQLLQWSFYEYLRLLLKKLMAQQWTRGGSSLWTRCRYKLGRTTKKKHSRSPYIDHIADSESEQSACPCPTPPYPSYSLLYWCCWGQGSCVCASSCFKPTSLARPQNRRQSNQWAELTMADPGTPSEEWERRLPPPPQTAMLPANQVDLEFGLTLHDRNHRKGNGANRQPGFGRN